MKKPAIPLLAVITISFIAFTLGFYLGRNENRSEIRVSIPAEVTAPRYPTLPAETEIGIPVNGTSVTFPININTATKEQLMALPGIGEVYAQRILAYREAHGEFHKVGDLLNVQGIGKKRLEEILDLIKIGE